ncbi:hypothetical protein WOLCODRAFT_106308 [Wolfiporia cocos MD-104 SS10]|uniref:Carbohydrate kinase PfkB domain-containing protein n=1 Tax=Wolfiporia cocos (strain MD-104) TaxID=742152 RepID=A0A2H3J7C2_WOLCO|nr:hypothetical protein WOLCODRAFT_106308 [Wolfiporia cocos MD-104 SS10]
MGRLRRDTDSTSSAVQEPLRIVAAGTLFLTHTLEIPTHPEPSTVLRASSVTRSRGGSACTCLAILAQFPTVEALLVAPLGGNEDGRRVIRELEKERVSTRFCKVWEEAGVPSAWVLHADDTDTRTVINNNPLPDITHEEFVSLLGPLLAPENYPPPVSGSSHAYAANVIASSTTGATANHIQQRPATGNSHSAPTAVSRTLSSSNSPAPFDWIHFEGRSVKTTLSNIMGLEGLARERKWRSHCVFSVDVGRRARQGVEALIPYADVIFLNKHYACAHSPQYAASPRAFLLSLTALVPPHALLVAHWGADGAAVLSVPTREYFQSSGWAGLERPPADSSTSSLGTRGTDAEVTSVRTGSDFYAGQHTDTLSVFTAGGHHAPPSSASESAFANTEPHRTRASATRRTGRRARRGVEGDSSDSDDTRTGREEAQEHTVGAKAVVDEVGAQEAFIAGMIFALSRRMLPGEPYTPSAASWAGRDGVDAEREKGRWRLEECLRFATELARRKAQRKSCDGLAEEMTRAGWFEG